MTLTQFSILFGVFLYFAVGAIFAYETAGLFLGFAGRLDWTVFALFFAWPIFVFPKFIVALPGILAIVAMTTAAYYLIKLWS